MGDERNSAVMRKDNAKTQSTSYTRCLCSCKYCKRVFTSDYALEEHRIFCSCQTCFQCFSVPKELEQHKLTCKYHISLPKRYSVNATHFGPKVRKIRSKEQRNKKDVCAYCKTIFSSPQNLEEHRMLQSCKNCYQCFATPKQLKCHSLTCKRSIVARQICHICKTVFISPTELEKHNMLHSCVTCYTCFPSNGQLRNHKLVCKPTSDSWPTRRKTDRLSKFGPRLRKIFSQKEKDSNVPSGNSHHTNQGQKSQINGVLMDKTIKESKNDLVSEFPTPIHQLIKKSASARIMKNRKRKPRKTRKAFRRTQCEEEFLNATVTRNAEQTDFLGQSHIGKSEIRNALQPRVILKDFRKCQVEECDHDVIRYLMLESQEAVESSSSECSDDFLIMKQEPLKLDIQIVVKEEPVDINIEGELETTALVPKFNLCSKFKLEPEGTQIDSDSKHMVSDNTISESIKPTPQAQEYNICSDVKLEPEESCIHGDSDHNSLQFDTQSDEPFESNLQGRVKQELDESIIKDNSKQNPLESDFQIDLKQDLPMDLQEEILDSNVEGDFGSKLEAILESVRNEGIHQKLNDILSDMKPQECEPEESSTPTIGIGHVWSLGGSDSGCAVGTDKPHAYCCEGCQTGFTSQEGLSEHMLSHTRGNRYCSICNRRFIVKDIIVRHLKQHTSYKPDPFMCQKCRKYFTCARDLGKHTEGVHSMDPLPYKCLPCETDFKDKELLNKHMFQHTVEDEFCGICCESYPKKGSLMQHVIRAHTEHRLYYCSICSGVDKKLGIKCTHQKLIENISHTFH